MYKRAGIKVMWFDEVIYEGGSWNCAWGARAHTSIHAHAQRETCEVLRGWNEEDN